MKRKLRCIIDKSSEVQKAETVKIDKYIFAVLAFNCKGYPRIEGRCLPIKEKDVALPADNINSLWLIRCTSTAS